MASKTLRVVSGLSNSPAALKGSAVLLIDIQNTYRKGTMKLENVEPAVKEAKKLLDEARAAGSLVIHVRHDAGKGSPYDLTEEIGQICSEVAPKDGETIITKNYPNSFIGTELEQILKKHKITDLVLAGFMSTARGAFNLGFQPTIVANATATRALPAVDGSVVSASELHKGALAGVADMFAVVVPNVADLKK